MTLLHPTPTIPAIDAAHTVSFTGFRPEKLLPTAPLHDLRELHDLLADRLEVAIKYLYANGYTCYLTGMAEGFDLWAAEKVAKLKAELPDLTLGCILPFPGHARKGGEAYQRILAAADFRHTVCPSSHRGSYLKRNDFLVDRSSLIICYYDGLQAGGTLYTLMRARKQGRAVVNLCTEAKGAGYNDGVEPQLIELVRNIRW